MADSKNIMSQISLMTKVVCYFCNQEKSNLSTFSICSHKICNSCLYWRIFSNHINEFQGQAKLTIKCKCGKGYLYQKLTEILKILKEKKDSDESFLYKRRNNIKIEVTDGCQCKINPRPEANKFSSFFCLDCLQYVCAKCKSDKNNMHFNHRVTDSKYLIRGLKSNIRNFDLKMKHMESFQERINSFSNKFEEIIERDFYITLTRIDDLLDSVNKLKEYYVKTYKEKVGRYIQTLSFLKIFYLNFYKDRDIYMNIVEPEKNNIYTLINLNSISHEFISMKLNHSTLLENEISKIKRTIDGLLSKEQGLVDGQFIFDKIKKGYKMQDSFQAHSKFIGGIIFTHNNNRIITSSKDYKLKVWDPKEEKKKVQEEPNNKIINLLSLKNGKILATKENHILIFELNEKKKYFNSQSLSIHDELVYALGELDDGTIISGSKDKKIIIWGETPDKKQYIVKQEIKTNKEIQMISVLGGFKIAFSGFNDNGINILDTDTVWVKKEEKMTKIIESTKYVQICELKEHKGLVNCICGLNLGYMASGGGDISKKFLDHNIYIWKPEEKGFALEQVIVEAHSGDVNCIILLRDGRMASSSKDHTIKIWGVNKYKKKIDCKVEFILEQTLNDYHHGLYKMIQLEDDSIVAVSSDNRLVFWNHSDIF